MLAQTTLTSKGQTTIPKEIRDSLGLQPYDNLLVERWQGDNAGNEEKH